MDLVASSSSSSFSSSSLDVFGNLSSELIEDILMKMPTMDAFRTGIVSRKWINAWSSMPKLVLDMNMTNINHESKFVEFVDRALMKRNTLLLDFELITRKRQQRIYTVSSHLFSHHKLVCLKLNGCTLTLPQNFKGFNTLKNLHLEHVQISSDKLQNLLSRCTQLQELTLIKLRYCWEIDIQNTRVKQLKIVGKYQFFKLENQHLISASIDQCFHHDEGFDNLQSIFLCKNLIYLEIGGNHRLVVPSLGDMKKLETLIFGQGALCLDSVSNLVSKCLHLKKLQILPKVQLPLRKIKLVSKSLEVLYIHVSSHLHVECPQLKDAAFDITFVFQKSDFEEKYFRLAHHKLDFKVLADLQTSGCLSSAFNHLKNLSLHVWFENLLSEYVAFLFLERVLVLSELEIKCYRGKQEKSLNVTDFWRYWNSIGLGFEFKHLKLLKIIDFHGAKEEFSFVAFMVDNSPMIQEIHVKFSTYSYLLETQGNLVRRLLQIFKMLKQTNASQHVVSFKFSGYQASSPYLTITGLNSLKSSFVVKLT